MNENTDRRLEQIKIENYIWIVYLIIIGLSYLSNYFEKDFFLNNNLESKNIYRKINILIFTMLILIYAYFEKDAINNFKEKDKSKTKEKYDTLILIGTTAVLLSGAIFLYIVLTDENLETEIAFS